MDNEDQNHIHHMNSTCTSVVFIKLIWFYLLPG